MKGGVRYGYAIHDSSRSDCALAVGDGFVIHDEWVYPHPARHRHCRDSYAYYSWPEAALTTT